MSRFTGIWVALVTPFQQHQIDFPALQRLAKHLVAADVAGLVVCGSTGEAAALSDREQIQVLDAVMEAVPHCPVVMGLADSNLDSALGRLEVIQQRVIAGLLVPPPAYIRPSQAGLLEYFQVLADAAKVPLILYNIPYRTGVPMSLATIRSLAALEQIVAIKDCGGDNGLTMQLIADGHIDVLSGEDQQLFSSRCLGATGAIMASAHIRPDLFVRLDKLIERQELDQARKLFHCLLPLINLLFLEPNPAPVKALLAQQGWIQDTLRSPMQAASAALHKQLREALAQLEKQVAH